MHGSVPDGWRLVRLDEVAAVISGGTPPRGDADCWNGNIPWLTPSEVTRLSGRTVYSTDESITETGAKRAGLTVLPPGSVVLTTRATIGAVARVAAPLTTNQGFQNLVPHEDVDAAWLFYAAECSRSELRRLSGGSTFKEVSRTSIRGLGVLLPPLPEQRAIAAVLDAIDDTIERTEAVIAATKELRRALLNELLTRGVPGWHSEWKDVPGIGMVPASWEVVRLGDVAEVMGGSTPSRANSEYWGGSVPWAIPSELTELKSRYLTATRESITDAGMKSAGLIAIPTGSILLTSRATIGVTAINTMPVVTNQGFQNLVVKNGIDSLWLYYGVSAMRRELERRAAGSTFLEVSRDSVRTLPILLPPLAEQRAIAAILDAIDDTIERRREERDGLQLLKASAADALLAGRLRVTTEVIHARRGS